MKMKKVAAEVAAAISPVRARRATSERMMPFQLAEKKPVEARRTIAAAASPVPLTQARPASATAETSDRPASVFAAERTRSAIQPMRMRATIAAPCMSMKPRAASASARP